MIIAGNSIADRPISPGPHPMSADASPEATPPAPSRSPLKKLLIAVAILVVIAILLGAVSAPAIMASREAARRSLCMNNLKMIGMALASYHDVYRTFPPAYVADENGNRCIVGAS